MVSLDMSFCRLKDDLLISLSDILIFLSSNKWQISTSLLAPCLANTPPIPTPLKYVIVTSLSNYIVEHSLILMHV